MKAIATELAASPAKRKQLLAIVRTPPARSWTRHSREELIAELREQRDAWELMSRRCQDLFDERLAKEPHAWLVESVKWYYSDEGRACAVGWLVELLQYLESTDARLRPRAAQAKVASRSKPSAGRKGGAQAAPESARERLKGEGFRYFTCGRGGAAKFWAIRVHGRRYTVAFGRIGTQGRVQSKDFGNPGTCQYTAERLVREKKAKGYRER